MAGHGIMELVRRHQLPASYKFLSVPTPRSFAARPAIAANPLRVERSDREAASPNVLGTEAGCTGWRSTRAPPFYRVSPSLSTRHRGSRYCTPAVGSFSHNWTAHGIAISDWRVLPVCLPYCRQGGQARVSCAWAGASGGGAPRASSSTRRTGNSLSWPTMKGGEASANTPRLCDGFPILTPRLASNESR